MNLELALKVKELRLQNKSRKEIKEELSIGDTSLSKYSKYAQDNLMSPEEVEKVLSFDRARQFKSISGKDFDSEDKNSYSYLKRRNRELNYQVDQLSLQLKTSHAMAELKPWQKGQVCELYALYRLQRAGFECFRPEVTMKAFDIGVILSNNRIVRCEVKGCSQGTICALSRTGSSDGATFKTSKYTEEDKIDFFICVLLESEQIFIVPFQETIDRGRNWGFGVNSYGFKFFERFDLIAAMVERPTQQT